MKTASTPPTMRSRVIFGLSEMFGGKHRQRRDDESQKAANKKQEIEQHRNAPVERVQKKWSPLFRFEHATNQKVLYRNRHRDKLEPHKAAMPKQGFGVMSA